MYCIECLARTRYDFPFTLRFLRNFQKLSIKNPTKVYRNVYAPGTVSNILKIKFVRKINYKDKRTGKNGRADKTEGKK